MKKKSTDDGKGPKKKATKKEPPARPAIKNAAKAATGKTKPKQELPEIESADQPKHERTKLSVGFIPKPTKPMRTGITKIIIENFKGIRERVEIPIRPITLLFGANSSGKTTILHALLYLRELLERQNADADRVIGGGKDICLGGFRQLVHSHDESKTVTVGVEFSEMKCSVLSTQA